MWVSVTRSAPACAAGLFAALLLSPGMALGDTGVFVEGEEFVNYGWHDLGGLAIAVEECSGASQGLAAGGLDLPGEWIQLKVTFDRGGSYDAHVFYQAEYGDTVAFDLRLEDASAPGGVVTASFEVPGWGVG